MLSKQKHHSFLLLEIILLMTLFSFLLPPLFRSSFIFSENLKKHLLADRTAMHRKEIDFRIKRLLAQKRELLFSRTGKEKFIHYPFSFTHSVNGMDYYVNGQAELPKDPDEKKPIKAVYTLSSSTGKKEIISLLFYLKK